MNYLTRAPLAIELDLVRAAEAASPHGVAAGEWNRYLLRNPDDSGCYEDGEFLWDEWMQAELSATGDATSAGGPCIGWDTPCTHHRVHGLDAHRGAHPECPCRGSRRVPHGALGRGA